MLIVMILSFISCETEIVKYIEVDKSTPTEIYTVSYETEYGTCPESFMFQSGYELTEEKLPVLEDTLTHKFMGWYFQNNLIKAGTKCRNNLVLKAKWQQYALLMEYNLLTDAVINQNPSSILIENLPYTLKKLDDYSDKTFFGWMNEKKEIVSQITSFEANSLKLTAMWNDNNCTYYSVNHYLENADDDNFTLAATEWLRGDIGQRTYAQPKTIEHFTAGNVEQKRLENENTEINIFYTREIITKNVSIRYSYKIMDPEFDEEGQISGYYETNYGFPSRTYHQIEGKYGSTIDLSAAPPVDLIDGFVITGYDNEIKMLDNSDVYIYAVSKKTFYHSHDTLSAIPSEYIYLPITYRDFRNFSESGTGDGFINHEQSILYGAPFEEGYGHPNFGINNDYCSKYHFTPPLKQKDVFARELDNNGKPVFLAPSPDYNDLTAASVNTWFNTIPGLNYVVKSSLLLLLEDNIGPAFSHTNNNFTPLDNQGYSNTDNVHNHNTTWTGEIEFYTRADSDFNITVKTSVIHCWLYANGKLMFSAGGAGLEEAAFYLHNYYAPEGDSDDLKPLERDQLVQIKIFLVSRFKDFDELSGYGKFYLFLGGISDIYYSEPEN